MKKTVSTTQRVLNVWAIILIIWSVYRTKLQMPEWFDEFIAKPLVFIVPVYWYIKRYDKINFFSSFWLKTNQIISDIILGLTVGFVFILSVIMSEYHRTGMLALNETVFAKGITSLIYILSLSFATAFSEELLSRGFILKKLYEESNNIFTSSLAASVLFFILHIPILFTNNRINGEMLLLFMGTNLLLSFANSFIFVIRKSLLLPILIHAFYNIAVILYI